MSRLGLLDRLQTVAATATLTSAVWIVVGTVYFNGGAGRQQASPAPARSASPEAPSRGRANPAELGDTELGIPVRGVAAADLADTFGDSRGGRWHEAIDIMAPAGTPVVAAASGTVERLFLSDAGGMTIYVRSNDRRTIHYYAHLQSYAPGLAEGQAVRRGQHLGKVGSTGNADPAAPHLHFQVLVTAPDAEWWEPSTAVNPYPLLIKGSH